MICIGAENNRENVSIDAEARAAMCASTRAYVVAPVLRMCYTAIFNGEDGIFKSGAAAATVIYLGYQDIKPARGITENTPQTGGGAGGGAGGVVSVAPEIERAIIEQTVIFIEMKSLSAGDSAGGAPVSDGDIAALKAALAGDYAKRGRAPLSILIGGAGLFVCGKDIYEALREAGRILAGGGVVYEGLHTGALRTLAHASPANDTAGGQNLRDAEYALSPPRKISGNRLKGKIALITGAAQGFGKGIAGELAAEGAYVAIADLNYEGAKKCAYEIAEAYGAGSAIAIAANVADEASVAAMVRQTVLSYGGLDIFISNAGVLIAGALPDMSKEQFELVTSINYTGYFLGAKHASVPMKLQHSIRESYMTDIIEINSKSGLEGSNKNFAYAGSKFGGVGLTQSFALELVEYGIKVNAVCPGNFLDGPLWSDPDRGLFKQYLDAGKVAGAKTVADVRRYYESRVPMKRGCTVADVAKAILYLIEQAYETGQALPVTGGQVMLR